MFRVSKRDTLKTLRNIAGIKLAISSSMNTSNFSYIVASDNVQDLTGNGLEYLLDAVSGKVIAVFYNGNFERSAPCGNMDATVKAA